MKKVQVTLCSYIDLLNLPIRKRGLRFKPEITESLKLEKTLKTIECSH